MKQTLFPPRELKYD
uniref:Uncharacterized protein n=1 Tax=Anguilla anguilla TaxID=7936 RepID=A0A0E9PS68_ANGAN